MKIKDGYILKEFAGEAVVVSELQSSGQSSIIELNESGALLWKKLQNGATDNDLIHALTEIYDVTADKAKADVLKFIEILKNADIIEE